MARAAHLLAMCAVASCAGPPRDLDHAADHFIDLGGAAGPDGEGVVELSVDVDGPVEVLIDLGAPDHILELAVDAPAGVVSELADDADADGPEAAAGARWLRPRVYESRTVSLALSGAGSARVTAWLRGPAVPAVSLARSLVWHDPAVLDDPSAVGLGRVMAALAADQHGGRLLDAWLRQFATTPHSMRAGPAAFVDAIAQIHGADPAGWDLDALPFRVTAVHNRLDLFRREPGTCGQLRVTVASIDPVYAPLHLIFLFAQRPADDDIAPDGAVHCLGTARRWGRLSSLPGDAFADAARALLADAVVSGAFLLAESLERIEPTAPPGPGEPGETPWEWRQWIPASGSAPVPATAQPFVNPPLLQTVDVDAVNAPGPLRAQFLAFVADNADALAERSAIIPDAFRAQSARVAEPGPAPALDLSGVPGDVLARHPGLARAIDLVGCPACHTSPAPEFVQTYPERFASDFHFHELEVRAELLDALVAGDAPVWPRYGPVQSLDHL